MAIIMLKKREINADLIREALLSYVKKDKIYSIEHLKGYLCAYLNVAPSEINELITTVCQEDFISLKNKNLLYGTLIKLTPEDINRYFINKIAQSKTIVSREDMIKNLRCLPMELRYECIRKLPEFSLKDDKAYIVQNPQDLFILHNPKSLKKDEKYPVEDNLQDIANRNEYVEYNSTTNSKDNFLIKQFCRIGVGVICTGAISLLGITLSNNLCNNNQSITMNAYTFDTASDDLILQWLNDTMSKHYELVETTNREFIKGTYNDHVLRLYQEVIHNYYEYIRVTDPKYYYSIVMNPEDAEEILNMAAALGTPIVPEDGTKEHQAFIKSAESFNEILLSKDYQFEYYEAPVLEENSQSLVLN